MVASDPAGGQLLQDLSPEILRALAHECSAVRPAETGDAVDGVAGRVVAAPASTAEAARLLRVAAEHDLAVVMRGNGTKLTWGRAPERVDLVLDTTRMSGVVEHAAGDLVVVVQAGTPLQVLQQALAPAGQRLALDETVPGSTVGGTVATATSGPHRLATGSVRDLIIGITVVRPDGVVAKAGGKVVKNVAGYDLAKLFTGSYGTLGLVTEAAFRLHPLPAATRWLAAPVTSPGEANRLVQAVIQSQAVPAAVEVDWPADGPGTVAVLLEGTRKGVDGRTVAVGDLLGPQAEVRSEPPEWWGRYPHGAHEIPIKITFAISGLESVLSEARAVAAATGLALSVRGSAGVGVVYGALPADSNPTAVSEVLDRLRGTCRPLGGTVVVLDAPADLKSAVDVWGPVAGLDLMRRVKAQFDPQRRFAPGRFVGGI